MSRRRVLRPRPGSVSSPRLSSRRSPRHSLQLAVSRQREYLADAIGAELLGRASPLADALGTLERRAQEAPLAVNPAMASLYIVNPLRRQGVATLFATHPPIAERVRRLRALDGDPALDARALLEVRTR